MLGTFALIFAFIQSKLTNRRFKAFQVIFNFFFLQIVRHFAQNMLNFEIPNGNTVISSFFEYNYTMSIGILKRIDNVDSYVKEIKRRILEYSQIQTLKKIFIHKWNLFTYIKEDKNFNIDDHISIIEEHLHTQKDLDRFLSQLMSEKCPADKPLWQLFLVRNYLNNASIFMFKCHHQYADGIGLISLCLNVLEPTSKIKYVQFEPPSKIKYILGSFISLFTVWKSYFYNLFQLKNDVNKFHPGKLSNQRQISTAGSIYVKILKEGVEKKFGKMSINHVLFCALIRSLELYYKQKFGKNAPLKCFNAMIPVSLRALPKGHEILELTNMFLPLMINFPIPQTDLTPLQRVHFYKKIFDGYKDSMDLPMLRNLITINHYIFPDFLNYFLNKLVLDRVTFIFSSLPGPIRKIDMDHQSKLSRILGFANGLANIGLFFIFFSYSDKITLCTNSDKAIDFSTEEFVDLFMNVIKTEYGYDDTGFIEQKMIKQQQHNVQNINQQSNL